MNTKITYEVKINKSKKLNSKVSQLPPPPPTSFQTDNLYLLSVLRGIKLMDCLDFFQFREKQNQKYQGCWGWGE